MTLDRFGAAPVTLMSCPYASPDVPEGWNTVLGYLAETNPEALALMDKDAEATLRDGYWLAARCKRLGIKPIKVTASTILLQQGVWQVNAYPLWLLTERLG